MGFIFKGILAVIWLLVVPCLAGGFYFRREKRTCGEYLLAGYTLCLPLQSCFSYHDFTKQPLHVLTLHMAWWLVYWHFWVPGVFIRRGRRKPVKALAHIAAEGQKRLEFPRSLWWQEF